MLSVNRLVTALQICISLLPAGISLYAVHAGSTLFAILSVVAVFAVVAILPVCRQRESIWIFFLLFLTATPLNVDAIVDHLSARIYDDLFLLTKILRGELFYLIAISMEELICGFLARLIWRRQLKTLLIQ